MLTSEWTDGLHCALEAAQVFLGGVAIDVVPLGSGHIHRTYKISSLGGSFLLQQFNTRVFDRPEQVMANIMKVHRHLYYEKGMQPVLTPVGLSSGEAFWTDTSGQLWRMFEFIEGGYVPEVVQTPQQAYLIGRAFGAFAEALADFDPTQLHEVIPGFHDSLARWHAFQQVLAKDPLGRAASAGEETDALQRQCHLFKTIAALGLPQRVTHNDAKAGNVLLRTDGSDFLAVVDWDTIMPGYVLADFGDLVRSIVSPVAEDDPRIEQVQVRLHFFEALCQGFLSEAHRIITPNEHRHLVLGAQWITIEQAMRFLLDYLAGDMYYAAQYEEHNLNRARNQLALAEAIQRHAEEMQHIAMAAPC